MFVGTMVIQKVERSVVTSLDVAETFEKEHSKVLRDIRELECSEDFRLSNFGQSSYINLQGKKMNYNIKEKSNVHFHGKKRDA